VIAPKIFTIAPGASFAQTLAQGLTARIGRDPQHLADTLIYLPTRRAARNFGDAFARLLGGAALLPQFRALGDSEEDDLLFDPQSDTALAPAIAPLRRQLLLAALIRRWDHGARGGSLSFAQAASLAASMAGVMDEIETQDIDPARLKDLAPDALAEHWRDVAAFLALIQNAWPGILKAEGRMNPAARRSEALHMLATRLAANPPDRPVIAAGSTGSIPATAALLDAIARLPQGAVILPGLDRDLDEKSWSDLDPGHPQFGMKQLLAHFGVARDQVRDWNDAKDSPRVTVLREALRPAPTTDAWRAITDTQRAQIARGLGGLTLLEAADPAQEALFIALALRQSLEVPEQSAALVTPDRNLARRVAAQLRRWRIEIDDTSGRPLSHTPAGTFLCLLADAAAARFAPVPLLALLKHPYALAGQAAALFRQRARQLDRLVLRGPAPDPGLDGITRAIALAMQDEHRGGKTDGEWHALAAWWQDVAALLRPLETGLARREAVLSEMLALHNDAATALSRDEDGQPALMCGEDGEAAQAFMAAFAEAAVDLPSIEADSYPVLFGVLAAGPSVRMARARHPRLAILGPLEARLQSFALVVLGGLNEGTWPATVAADPWFSRPMRQTLGLEQPERAIGLAAHDFSVLACQPRVLLTRARKAQGAPTIASRWLQRLTQLTRGLDLKDALQTTLDFPALATALTAPECIAPIAAPAPTPPVAARPRALSVTEIETWLRDPYAIYAKHILRLRPLKDLQEDIGPLERGSAVHRALELFVHEYRDALPQDGASALMRIADTVFAEAGIPKAVLALWRPRFLSAAHWFVDMERVRRRRIVRSHLEIKGVRYFPGPHGPFQLSGRADRIDELQAGGGAIIDYKTGTPPSLKQVRQLLAPQLPLEGAILSSGGFEGVGALASQELAYLRFSGGLDPGEVRDIPDAAMLAEKVVELLTRRIAIFDDAATPYRSRVRPWRADLPGDYDHLARVREWSLTGWDDE
jgi:ATP-dependent helicase/nuclease subunit B